MASLHTMSALMAHLRQKAVVARAHDIQQARAAEIALDNEIPNSQVFRAKPFPISAITGEIRNAVAMFRSEQMRIRSNPRNSDLNEMALRWEEWERRQAEVAAIMAAS